MPHKCHSADPNHAGTSNQACVCSVLVCALNNGGRFKSNKTNTHSVCRVWEVPHGICNMAARPGIYVNQRKDKFILTAPPASRSRLIRLWKLPAAPNHLESLFLACYDLPPPTPLLKPLQVLSPSKRSHKSNYPQTRRIKLHMHTYTRERRTHTHTHTHLFPPRFDPFP